MSFPEACLRGVRTIAFPRWPVVDTAALARQILLRDEVPANCRLATLARHFHTAITPNHRALTDAQAAVEVFHGLLERVGNLGVHTSSRIWLEFSRKGVTAAARQTHLGRRATGRARGLSLRRRARRAGATFSMSASPRTFGPECATTSRRLRNGRGSIDEMVRLATGVEAVPCLTQLQADVTELRLIGSSAPRYNRRSKFPERTRSGSRSLTSLSPWLSMVRVVRDDGATYFGPFTRRSLPRT